MSVPLPPAKPPSRLDYGTKRGEVRAIPVHMGSGVLYELFRWDGHDWQPLTKDELL